MFIIDYMYRYLQTPDDEKHVLRTGAQRSLPEQSLDVLTTSPTERSFSRNLTTSIYTYLPDYSNTDPQQSPTT
jgi:hypothetical protein